MPVPRRLLLAATLAAPSAPLAARPGHAQAVWPDRPVRVVVPFPAGSTPDLAARAVAAHLQAALGQPFVPDNRAGAGGNIGTDAIAKATDGHVIGVSINAPLTTAPFLYPTLPFDPERDLAPISLLVRAAQLLVVHPAVPATDLAGFIAHARANPGALAYGSVGAGSGSHLAMADLMARTGTEMVHVPYRGFPDATLDLVAGRIQAMFVVAAGILPQLRAGTVRGLAATAERRIAQAPEVPTLAEGGIAGAASYAWVGLVAPAATPPERIARLAAETRRGLAEHETRQRLEAAGFEVVGSTPEQFAAYMAAERTRWGGLIRRLGIRAEG